MHCVRGRRTSQDASIALVTFLDNRAWARRLPGVKQSAETRMGGTMRSGADCRMAIGSRVDRGCRLGEGVSNDTSKRAA
jgi:hypothetical protein